MESQYRVFIVDDDILAVQALSTLPLWENYGCKITGAFCDPRDAIKALGTETVDLIFCDVKMPFMDGISFSRYCYEQHINVTIILMSAYPEFKYAQAAIQYKVNNFLLKPLTPRKITSALIRALDEIRICRQERLPQNAICNLQKILFNLSETRHYNSVNELEGDFSAYSIDKAYLFERICLVFDIRISEFEEYMQHTWKHGNIRLYSAVSNVLNYISDDYIIVVLRYHNNLLHCIMIKNKDQGSSFDNCLERIRSELLSLLALNIEFPEMAFYPSLQEYFLAIHKEDSLQKKESYVHDALELMNRCYARADFNINTILDSVFVSKSYFCKIFKELTGQNFTDKLNDIRIEKAREYLQDGSVKISGIYQLVGFHSERYFYRVFKQKTGMSPMEYRKRRLIKAKNKN